MSHADFQQLAQPACARTIAYGDDPLQHVELWRPAGPGPFPVMILVHGGCWQTAVAGAETMRLVAGALARRGVAVWNVEYRGVDVPGGGYPGTFADVATAADLLGERGEEFGLIPRGVVAMGHSAGAHLAFWLAARHRIARGSALYAADPLPLRGVVSLGGLLDLKAARTEVAEACGVDTVDRLIGRATPGRPDPFADTSPEALLPIGTRQMLVSGAADVIAPPHVASRYVAMARAHGEDVASMTIAGQGHFELIAPGTPAGEAALDAALALLADASR